MSKSGGASRTATKKSAIIDERWEHAYDEEQMPAIAAYAREHGMTRAEYEQAVTRTLREALSGARVFIKRTAATSAVILREGRFKTLHETGRSGGEPDTASRRAIEERLFGRVGAIYAYAARPKEAVSANEQYGTVTFEIKPSALHGATVAFADTLYAAGLGVGKGKGSSGPSTPRAGFVPSPLSAPTYRAWDYAWGRDPLHVAQEYHLSRFAEVQLHGGLRASDIARAYLASPGDHPQAHDALVTQLERLGIPYSMDE